jgi:hypothetical protein
MAVSDKHPILMVLIRVLATALLLLLAGLAGFFAFMNISGFGPDGGSWPPQHPLIGVLALLISLAALAGAGLCLGLVRIARQKK